MLGVQNVLQRSADQGQRGAQLMTGIAEEVVLHQTHFMLQLLTLLPVIGVEYTCHYRSEQ